MEKYKVSIKRSAVTEIEAIPQKKERKRMIRRIGQLANGPRPPGTKKLSGHDKHRIHQGSYRIVCGIEDNGLVVAVAKVGHGKVFTVAPTKKSARTDALSVSCTAIVRRREEARS